MRGNPLFRFLAISAVFALAGLPVWWVTRGAPASQEQAGSADSPAPDSKTSASQKTVAFRYAITCAPAPENVRIEHLGKEIFSSPAGSATAEGEFSIPGVPAEGADFVVRAEWPKGKETGTAALRLVLESAGTRRETTFWAKGGSLADVMTFMPARKRTQQQQP